jgi:hypothetical protein
VYITILFSLGICIQYCLVSVYNILRTNTHNVSVLFLVYVKNNGVKAMVLQPNIPTVNGVIHVIDNLLYFVYMNIVQTLERLPNTQHVYVVILLIVCTCGIIGWSRMCAGFLIIFFYICIPLEIQLTLMGYCTMCWWVIDASVRSLIHMYTSTGKVVFRNQQRLEISPFYSL